MDRIRVLMTVPHLASTASPYREMITIAELLPKDEFDLTICSLRANGYEETYPKFNEFGVKYLVARFRPRGYSLSKIVDALRDQRLINSYGPFDLQHSWDFTASPFEAVIARLNNRRFIHVQRNMNENSSKVLLQMKARLSHRIHANAEATRQLLLSYGVPEAKVTKIYNGLDLTQIPRRIPQSNPEGGRYILSVGHLQERKRQEDAIRVLARLAAEMPDLRLKIAGSTYNNDYYEKLILLVDELNVKDRVDFLGVRSDILELMQGAEALLLCSERDALSWVIVEAMAVGLPVIASAVDGSLEAIESGRTGFLVPVADINGYVVALQKLLQQPELSKEISKNAHKKVEEHFSAQSMVRQVAEMYREVARDS